MSQQPQNYYSYSPYQSLFLGMPSNNQDFGSRLSVPNSMQNSNITFNSATDGCKVDRQFLDGIARMETKLDEIKNSLLNFMSEYRSREEKSTNVEELLKRVLERLSEKEQGAPLDYTFVPYEKVAELYDAFSTNPRAFVRALEIFTYQDQIYELQTAVNKRFFTADRVDFIRKCLFHHFNVPRNLQDDVWRSVRSALDKRSYRLRQSRSTKQSGGFRTSTPVSDLLEGLGYFDRTEKEIV